MGNFILTGGTKGLGFATAQLLAEKKDNQLVITGRDSKNGLKKVNKLKLQSGNSNIHFIRLDLGDFESISSFLNRNLRLLWAGIDGLINNAGIQYVSPTKYTKQGYELTFGVNHLGHFFLTDLLIPFMNKDSIIINVASGVHNPNLKTGIPNPVYTTARELASPENNFKTTWRKIGQTRYSTSKLCNILYTYRLARQFASDGIDISVVAFDPGMMPGTGLADDYPFYMRWIWKNIWPIRTLFTNRINTPTQSAKTLVRIAQGSIGITNGTGYFYVGGEEKSSPQSYDESLQEDLWLFSLAEVKKFKFARRKVMIE